MPIQQMFMGLGAGGAAGPTWTATGGNSVYPSVTIDGVAYKIHKFTSPGNFVISPGSGGYDVIVIAGGGSGGVDNGGAGGAGGVVDATVPDAVVTNGTFGVSIGSGGAARPGPTDHGVGNPGANTTFTVNPTITLTAKGGGAGNGWNTSQPGNGGSAAGQSGDPGSGGPQGSATQPGTNPQPWATDLGNTGGAWSPSPTGGYAGGGGGAGGQGQNASGAADLAGYGGLGYLTNGKYGTNPTGLDEYPSGRIAGGGTGGFDAANGAGAPPTLNTSPNPHNGVLKLSGNTSPEAACAANTGGGGHGANHDNNTSGAGGSGVVVIRYVA